LTDIADLKGPPCYKDPSDEEPIDAGTIDVKGMNLEDAIAKLMCIKNSKDKLEATSRVVKHKGGSAAGDDGMLPSLKELKQTDRHLKEKSPAQEDLEEAELKRCRWLPHSYEYQQQIIDLCHSNMHPATYCNNPTMQGIPTIVKATRDWWQSKGSHDIKALTTNGIDSFKNFVEQRNHDVLVALMGRSPEDKPRSLAGRQAEILVTKFQRRDVKERIMKIKKWEELLELLAELCNYSLPLSIRNSQIYTSHMLGDRCRPSGILLNTVLARPITNSWYTELLWQGRR
jgi:hypothetical protein